jgi:endonuclease G
MATTKKKTTSSPKKISSKSKPVKKTTPKRKTAKKKSSKQSAKKLSYSTIIIIILAVSAYFYINWSGKDDKGDILNQVEEQQTDIIVQTGLVDGKELSYYFPSADLSNGGIINHLAYSLDYNEEYEQADWVIYELTKEEVQNKKVARKDKFAKDPATIISSALPTDYYKSGYDRGHLCPAADNRWSQDAMDQSFYMSNMSPQDPDLNRKIWKELEEKVRDWAVDNDNVFVVTGPILADGFKKQIGKSDVAVPNYFYKVVADLTGDEIKGIGFIFVNGENNGELKNYGCSIDMVEKRTKIDFFPNLADEIENQIESDYIIEDWF